LISMQRSNVWPASTIIGDRVRNPAGENLGKIEDVVVDPSSGTIMYAVLSFGGFLGIRDKLFAIPWDELSLGPGRDHLILDTDRETLDRAEGFDPNHWPDMSDPAWQNQTARLFGHGRPSFRETMPVRERTVVVEKEVRRGGRSLSVVGVAFLLLLLLGIGWLGWKVSTQGWDRTRAEIVNTMQGAAYAMKETSEDATLTAKVQTAFSLSSRIPSSTNINVDTQDGIVTLRGEVGSNDIRAHAEAIARDVPGVRDVRNHLYAMNAY
jgi:sporulation protein YlmC with PRC-barrel domain